MIWKKNIHMHIYILLMLILRNNSGSSSVCTLYNKLCKWWLQYRMCFMWCWDNCSCYQVVITFTAECHFRRVLSKQHQEHVICGQERLANTQVQTKEKWVSMPSTTHVCAVLAPLISDKSLNSLIPLA